MALMDLMEKKIFFRIIRLFGFFICLLAFVTVIFSVILIIANYKDTFPSHNVQVSNTEVQNAVTEKENKKRLEQYHEATKKELQRAWKVAQKAYMKMRKPAPITLELLEKEGFIPATGIKIDIIDGTRHGLNIQGKHEQGQLTYKINSVGYISIAEAAPVQVKDSSEKPKPRYSFSDPKMEALLNEMSNSISAKEEKIREIIVQKTQSLPKEYQLFFMQGLAEVVKQAPEKKKTEYADEYIDIYTGKVAALEAENMMKEVKARSNIKIYAMSVGGGIVTIALFGLILVLLRIEKNTRKSEE